MSLGFGRIWRKGNLGRRAPHVQEAIRVVVLPMVVPFRIIESSQQVIRGDPPVQALRLARNHLHVQIAVWQLKLCRLARIGAYLLQHRFPLEVGQYAHAGGGEEEKGRVRDFVLRDVLERMVEQLVGRVRVRLPQVQAADEAVPDPDL